LNLTAEQRTQLDELQKEVDGKLGKILTDEQKQQLRAMQDGFGPGGRGRRGGLGPDGGDLLR
jgi:Spy/CpxP family protein refolding chaperone